MTPIRIGELFSGYGGLGAGVQSVLGGDIVWHSEIDPGACKILAHRYPAVPNLGDITAVDWSQVEPVDVLTGGFPCQDVSAAGKQAGIAPGTRSGLWSEMHRAIVALRPPLTVIENVRGLLSADAHHPAHSDVEPCPWCMGDDEQRPLRALGAVLGELADLGYDASWQGVRASDVGAPHERFRVFVVAWPASHTDRLGHERSRWARDWRPGSANGSVVAAHAHSDAVRKQPVALPWRSGPAVPGHPGADAASDTDRIGWAGRTETSEERSNGGRSWATAPRPSAHTAADSDDDQCSRERSEQPGGATAARCGARAAADPDSGGWGTNLRELRAGQPDTDWGPYGSAIRRWELVLGRSAPAPTEPGGSGMARIRQFAHDHNIDGYTAQAMLRSGKWGARLAPPFVEWMQGLRAGWVTDVPGITRNEQLKALGNGVVPQQAAHALRLLLPDVAGAVA